MVGWKNHHSWPQEPGSKNSIVLIHKAIKDVKKTTTLDKIKKTASESTKSQVKKENTKKSTPKETAKKTEGKDKK